MKKLGWGMGVPNPIAMHTQLSTLRGEWPTDGYSMHFVSTVCVTLEGILTVLTQTGQV